MIKSSLTPPWSHLSSFIRSFEALHSLWVTLPAHYYTSPILQARARKAGTGLQGEASLCTPLPLWAPKKLLSGPGKGCGGVPNSGTRAREITSPTLGCNVLLPGSSWGLLPPRDAHTARLRAHRPSRPIAPCSKGSQPTQAAHQLSQWLA